MRLRWWLAMALMLLPLTAMAKQTILVFGDSLSAAYGIERESGWVSLLQQRLATEKLDYTVVNASVSGETTSGGLRRLASAIAESKPAIVIVELGANDGLRGLPINEMEQNLAKMLEMCRNKHISTLLIGMKIPPNYGPAYTREFETVYIDLAKRYKIPYVPFLLAGVAGDPTQIQPDGLHPNAKAQSKLLSNIWPSIKHLLSLDK